MSSTARSPMDPNPPSFNSAPEPIRASGGLIFAGIVLALVGVWALATPALSSLAFGVTAGWLLMIVGLARLIRAFQERHQGGLLFATVFGIFTGVVGLGLVVYPVGGILALAWMLGFYLTVTGILNLAWGFSLRPFPGTGWLFAQGIINLLCGLLVLAGWPAAAPWVLGTFLGVDFLVSGIAALSAGVALRRTERIFA